MPCAPVCKPLEQTLHRVSPPKSPYLFKAKGILVLDYYDALGKVCYQKVVVL